MGKKTTKSLIVKPVPLTFPLGSKYSAHDSVFKQLIYVSPLMQGTLFHSHTVHM